MRAVRLRAGGALGVEEIDVPRPGPGEALVRVHAAAITRGELEWPVDRLPAIPSYELSGVVEEVGAEVAGVAAGDEVFALTPFDRDGVAADYAAVPAGLLAPKPESLEHPESAAIPLPAMTAWQGLFDHGELAPGQRVLITGAAGAVGSFAVQLAGAAGAHVVDAKPVDLVFDTTGDNRTHGGRLVSVAEPSDDGVYFIVEPDGDRLRGLAEQADRGELRPPPVEVFPLADAPRAFARSLERGRRGKVVLAVVA